MVPSKQGLSEYYQSQNTATADRWWAIQLCLSEVYSARYIRYSGTNEVEFKANFEAHPMANRPFVTFRLVNKSQPIFWVTKAPQRNPEAYIIQTPASVPFLFFKNQDKISVTKEMFKISRLQGPGQVNISLEIWVNQSNIYYL